jgi:lysophospholipase L1-like esterase
MENSRDPAGITSLGAAKAKSPYTHSWGWRFSTWLWMTSVSCSLVRKYRNLVVLETGALLFLALALVTLKISVMFVFFIGSNDVQTLVPTGPRLLVGVLEMEMAASASAAFFLRSAMRIELRVGIVEDAILRIVASEDGSKL